MHLTGFEPVMFLRKWIMSPAPSTTRPQVQIMKKRLPERNLRDLNPRAYTLCLFQEGPIQSKRKKKLVFFSFAFLFFFILFICLFPFSLNLHLILLLFRLHLQ